MCTLPGSWVGAWYESGVRSGVNISLNELSHKGTCVHSRHHTQFIFKDRYVPRPMEKNIKLGKNCARSLVLFSISSIYLSLPLFILFLSLSLSDELIYYKDIL